MRNQVFRGVSPGRGGAVGLAFVLAGLVAQGATAQGDWLRKGKDLLGGAGRSAPAAAGELTDADIGSGLKDALRVGTERVVGRLGRPDGFNADPEVHIPLPGSLDTVRSALRTVGQSGLLDDLELRLNRAAEVATPKAKELFWQAISEMTLEDARGILDGPSDSATRYFQGKMSEPLGASMRPVVDESLAEAGAVQAYDRAMGQYRAIPFVPDAKANLTDYVLEKGIDGIFHYLGQEEAAIRSDPAQRTTDLLRRVFGG